MAKSARKIRSLLEAAFLLLIFSLGFMQPEIWLGGVSLTVTEGIFLVVCGLWLIAFLLKQVEFRWDSTFWLITLYAVGLLLSASLSENPRISFVKYLGEIYLIGLAVVTVNVAGSERMIKRVIFAWLAASTITAVAGVAAVVIFFLGLHNFVTEFALHSFGSLPPGNYPRIQSTFLYPSMLCNYLTVSLMMLLAAHASGWLRTGVFAVLMALFIAAIAFTLTPGIGGVLLALGIWYWFEMRKRGNAVPAKLALFGGVAAAAGFWLISTFTVITSPTSPFYYMIAGVRIDPTQRLLTWMNAGRTFLAHPFFGNGLGLTVAQVYFMPPSGQMQLLTDAHNFLLNIAAQAGLAGVIPLVLICVAVIWRRTAPGIDNGNKSMPLALWIAFLSAFLYQGLVGSFEDARHLWVLIGLLIATQSPKSKHSLDLPISDP